MAQDIVGSKMSDFPAQQLKAPADNTKTGYGQNGYMFPRADHVVIGGTFEVGVNDTIPSKSVCQGLVDHIKSLFGQAAAKPLPDIHIHHPNNLPIGNPAVPEV